MSQHKVPVGEPKWGLITVDKDYSIDLVLIDKNEKEKKRDSIAVPFWSRIRKFDDSELKERCKKFFFNYNNKPSVEGIFVLRPKYIDVKNCLKDEEVGELIIEQFDRPSSKTQDKVQYLIKKSKSSRDNFSSQVIEDQPRTSNPWKTQGEEKLPTNDDTHEANSVRERRISTDVNDANRETTVSESDEDRECVGNKSSTARESDTGEYSEKESSVIRKAVRSSQDVHGDNDHRKIQKHTSEKDALENAGSFDREQESEYNESDTFITAEKVNSTTGSSLIETGEKAKCLPAFSSKPSSNVLSNYCKIVEPQPKFIEIHQQILNKIDERLAQEDLSARNANLHLVTAVNNSRITADVKRDIAKAVGEEEKDIHIILLIIKATRILSKPRAQIKDMEDSRIKEICFFLTDVNLQQLHECQTNSDSVDVVINFLKGVNK